MTIERFLETVSRNPFRPFTIHLADGERIRVVGREFVASSPSGRTVVVFDPEDRMSIIDLLLVTKLELETVSNGHKRQNRK
jgi:hypothetical protein